MLKSSKKWTAWLLVMVLSITSIVGIEMDSFAAEAVKGVIYQNDGCEVQFKVNSQWESGFEGQFIVINNSDKPLENWRIRLTFKHEITSIWDGEMESHSGNVYIIKHPSWNSNIPAGGKAVVGFNGKSNGTVTPPSDCTMPGGSSETSKEDYTITYRTTSDWSDAFNGEISLTNHTKKSMENWQLEFDFEKDITQLWNAKLVKHQGNHYIIKHDDWNSVIKAGATVKFGFEGKTGNVTTEPSGYKLTKSKADVDTGGEEIEFDSTDPDGDGLIGGYEN